MSPDEVEAIARAAGWAAAHEVSTGLRSQTMTHADVAEATRRAVEAKVRELLPVQGRLV